MRLPAPAPATVLLKADAAEAAAVEAAVARVTVDAADNAGGGAAPRAYKIGASTRAATPDCCGPAPCDHTASLSW
jgi:hypothetical protein